MVDPSFSLAIEEPNHAWFNVAFVLLLAPALIVLERACNRAEDG